MTHRARPRPLRPRAPKIYAFGFGWALWAGVIAPAAAAEAEPAPVGAEAEAPEPASGPSVRLEAASQFPIFIGGALTLGLPGRLELGGAFGVVPEAYLDTAATVVTSVAGLEATESDIVQSALDGQWAARAFVGWRPFDTGGLYLRFGYQALRLGASLDTTDLATVSGIVAAAQVSATVSAQSTLHMLYGEVGYRWLVDGLTVRLSLGFTGTVSSEVDLSVDMPTQVALAEQLVGIGETYLQDELQTYTMTPTLGLAVGYELGL